MIKSHRYSVRKDCLTSRLILWKLPPKLKRIKLRDFGFWMAL